MDLLFARSRALRATLALLMIATAPLALAAQCPATLISTGLLTNVVTGGGSTTPYGWEGDYLEAKVCFPSRQSGARLHAWLYAPPDISERTEALPIILIGPGSGTGRAKQYLYAARELAASGHYLALVTDPQGVGDSGILGDPARCTLAGCPGVPFQQASNYVDGLSSALDFAVSRDHPWLALADLEHIGLAGHSLSARAASQLQGVDDRIKALVAWDNLASDLAGDAGSSSGGDLCGALIGGELPSSSAVIARVPALGQASDRAPTCAIDGADANVKASGAEYWRRASVASMQVVFRGATHADWSQASTGNAALPPRFQHYTRAWFDWHLRGDPAGLTRLMAAEVADAPLADVLSENYRSMLYLPEIGLDCTDLRTVPCQWPSTEPDPAGTSEDAAPAEPGSE